MLPRNLTEMPPSGRLAWDDLAAGLPTIIALARLASDVLATATHPACGREELATEAQAILYAARDTGSISLRADKNSIDPGERFLAVTTELADGQHLEFRIAGNPELTVRFVEGFRQLCCAGLVMHQVLNEFSLTAAGFDRARLVNEQHLRDLLALARRG